MGNSLNKRVSAVGVETREQLASLRTECCGEGQGYYFSRPVGAEEYTKLLRTGIAGISELSRSHNVRANVLRG